MGVYREDKVGLLSEVCSGRKQQTQLENKGKQLDIRKSFFFFCEGDERLQRGFGMLILGDARI